MNILISSASYFEIKQLSDHLKKNHLKNLDIDILISGVGLTFTSYSVAKALLSKKYDLAINCGICGSYRHAFKKGDVVNVISEEFADLGINDNGTFKSLFEEKLLNDDEFPFKSQKLINETDLNFIADLNLPLVKSVSVNMTSGEEKIINKLMKKYNPDIENMEGAAFFYVCLMENIPFIEIRAVSNYVEPRNKENWEVSKAVRNLNDVLITVLSKMKNS